MILVTGCTGFVGSNLVNALVDKGLGVRCLARGTGALDRLPQEHLDFAVGDITDPTSLVEAVSGIDTVIHLVGIIREKGNATFERVHVEGTRNLLEAAKTRGVRHFIHMSALGASPSGRTAYQRTKWEAEELTRRSGLEWIVVRPSIMIGRWGEFLKTLIDLVRIPPVIPIIGSGDYQLQPLYVGDLVQAFIEMLDDDSLWGRTYEFGGPDKLTFNRMIDITKEVLGTRKPAIHLPIALMRPLVRVTDALTSRFPITTDQITMMADDSVTDHNAFTEVFGIDPVPFAEALRRSL